MSATVRSLVEEGEARRDGTKSLIEFSKIEKLETMDEVRKYLNWDAEVAPLPGEVKWYTDDKRTWEERRQSRVDKKAAEKEEKRLAASNPTKPRVPSQHFMIEEFLAEKEAIADVMLLAMFHAAMLERRLRAAPYATYNRLWDTFVKESNG